MRRAYVYLAGGLVLTLAAIGLMLSRWSPADSGKPGWELPVTRMKIGQRTFELEIARTEAHRSRGLMFRDSMPPDHGMLFVFQTEERQGFYMRNTRIPLDILFLDSSGTVVSIHQMYPFDESSTLSAAPARYAIELNQGAAAAAGVKAGDRLSIPPEALK